MASMASSACYYDNEEELYPEEEPIACDTAGVSYTTFIAPLLQQHCVSCHSGQFPSGNVRLGTYEEALALAENGQLVGVIAWLPGFSPMPEGGPQLPDCDIERVSAWVRQGANDN